jgi:hypothetical protein
LLTCLAIAVLPPAMTIPEAAPMREIARIEMPPRESPIVIEAIPPEELSGYDIAGMPFNISKIAARRASLFPFLTADLSFIERIATDVRTDLLHLENPLDQSLHAKPLVLEGSVRQHLIDESWSRRDRWQRFKQIAALLVGHDAHHGDAPALVRAYLDQNLLQPYCDGKTKDGQFWALLENAAEHADFLEFIRLYTRTRSASRTTTELLFLADELAQASREVAVNVLSTNVSHDLIRTAVEGPRAALLAASVSQDLRRWLAANRLSPRDIGDAYDRVRLRLLATIVETTPDGYREADARFLAGEIFYVQGNIDQASEWWGAMRPSNGDSYVPAARAMAAAIHRTPLDEFAIRRALATERARWHAVNYERLKKFGYRCDSF